eukprot:77010_1
MFPFSTILPFMLLMHWFTPFNCVPVCGYENGPNSTYVCVCDSYEQCHSATIQCPTNGTCRVECLAVAACYGGSVEWPLSPGSGTIICHGGRSACRSMNFPIPLPYVNFSFDCDQELDCAFAQIYCPQYANCHITCSAKQSCKNAIIHWSPNHVQSTLSCTYGNDECLGTTLPPSDSPTSNPTTPPTTTTTQPTQPPTNIPTHVTSYPTVNPTQSTVTPTSPSPTIATVPPTLSPSAPPSSGTSTPTNHPTSLPTHPPSTAPSEQPSISPTPAPVCGYVDSEYTCLCPAHGECKKTTLVCPSNSTCRIECSGSSACYATTIQWPIAPGSGTLTCQGRSACNGVNFPIPLPYQDLFIDCADQNLCANADIYCPEYANCHVTCAESASCRNAVIHWSPNDVQTELICSGFYLDACDGTNLPPTPEPTTIPTLHPTQTTSDPTLVPSTVPTTSPTDHPSIGPTLVPSIEPTIEPTLKPSKQPTVYPTNTPSVYPTSYPTTNPTQSTVPPTLGPTNNPTPLSLDPTHAPSTVPTTTPTANPSIQPSLNPVKLPTVYPTNAPSMYPTSYPSVHPTQSSAAPTVHPTNTPTVPPTLQPSRHPTSDPSKHPTNNPTQTPTVYPTIVPTESPTKYPTVVPTIAPSRIPTLLTLNPTVAPSSVPTIEQTITDVNEEQAQGLDPIVVIGILSTVIIVLCLCGCFMLVGMMIKNKNLVIMMGNEVKDVSPGADTDTAHTTDRKDTIGMDDIPGAATDICHVADAEEEDEMKGEADMNTTREGDAVGGDRRCSEGVKMTGIEMTDIDVDCLSTPSDAMTPRGIALMDSEAYGGVKSPRLVRKAQQDAMEVQAWVDNELELPQYFDVFISNGYESMNLIQDIPDADELKEIGIVSKEHQIKIMNAIEAWKSEQYVKEHRTPV